MLFSITDVSGAGARTGTQLLENAGNLVLEGNRRKIDKQTGGTVDYLSPISHIAITKLPSTSVRTISLTLPEEKSPIYPSIL